MSIQSRLSASTISISKAKRLLVNEVSLTVDPGELVGLIGPNGAGKSTLLAALAGVDQPDSGDIILDGRPIQHSSNKERARTIGWLEQTGTVNWPITVERLVMLGRIPHLPAWSEATATDRHAVEQALTLADCLTLRHQPVTTLSGGERARALLARALAAEPTLLYADEPVSSLDLGHQLQTMQLLRAFANEHHSAVVVLHDLSLAARFCDRLYLMHQGSIAASGSASSVLSAENLATVYGVSVLSGNAQIPWIVPLERL